MLLVTTTQPPLSIRPALGRNAFMSPSAAFGAATSAACVVAESLSKSNGLPGTMPSSASCGRTGASAATGGLFFSSYANIVKNALPLIALTCLVTAVFMSIDESTLPAAGVYGLPYELSGTAFIWSCSL